MGAAKVNGGTAGGAAVVDCITAGGAVGVNCGAAGRQQGFGLAAGKAAKQQRSEISCRREQQNIGKLQSSNG